MHRLASGRPHGLGDLRRVGGDSHRADPRLDGPAPDMRDHRFARDIGEGLVGQAGGAQAGGDEDERIGHGAGA